MLPSHLDLFSGIGGFALAAKWAGFETVAFCEIEPYCHKVLRKNFGNEITIHDDIRQLDGAQYRDIDLITGGFPCQPFSIAGMRRGTADSRNLWPEMRRIIHEAKPAWVVGENVAHFVNMELDNVCSDLEGEGYEVQPLVIPACGVGAPHRRYRTFIVALSNADRGGRTNRDALHERRRACESWAESISQKPRWKDDFAICDAESTSQDASNTVYPERRKGNSKRRDTSREHFILKDRAEDTGKSKQYRGIGEWWATEPDVGRVANGIPARMDRIKGLGNAVVPQQAYPILELIARAITCQKS